MQVKHDVLRCVALRLRLRLRLRLLSNPYYFSVNFLTLFVNLLNDLKFPFFTGYRGLSLDLCNCNGILVFCHGGKEVGCGIGERDPIETLKQINQWITLHPNNVIMIWLQINESAGGPISLKDVDQIVKNVPLGTANLDFSKRLYQRDRYEDDAEEWPTLSELIQNEEQILFFYMGGPDGGEESSTGIHYFYEYGMSTHWSYPSVSDLRDTASNGCVIKRDSSNRRDFLMVNDFVTKSFWGYNMRPSREAAEEINQGTFLQPILDACERTHRNKVNIISVDFWKSGNLIKYIDDQNSKLTLANTYIPSTSKNDRPWREQRTSVQNHTYQSSNTMTPSYDGIDTIASHSKRQPHSKRQRSFTPINADTGNILLFTAIPGHRGLDKVAPSSLDSNSYSQDNTLSTQQIDNDYIKQASVHALEASDDNLNIKFESAAPVPNHSFAFSSFACVSSFVVALIVMTTLSNVSIFGDFSN
jgi:hypothetical protein